MCYDLKSTLESHLKRALQLGDKDGYQKTLEELWSYLSDVEREQYYVSGFQHPHVVVQLSEDPQDVKISQWGLIPHWSKDRESAEKFWNNTLNARGETIFEKPSFRDAAKQNRCVIIVDGFYEHHHYKGKAYPFHIYNKDTGYLILGGLWSEWLDKETGELRHTFTLVTTRGNELMAKIHNNPKLSHGPRMPVILQEDQIDTWINGSKDELDAIMKTMDKVELDSHTVHRIKGKEFLGNIPEVAEPFEYEDLIFDGEDNELTLF